MSTDRNAARAKATPQEAAVLMGLMTLGVSWASTGSVWRAVVVAVVVGGAAYAGQRWSLAREQRKDQSNVPPRKQS